MTLPDDVATVEKGFTLGRVSREAVKALQRQGRLPQDQPPDKPSIAKAVADLLSSTVHANG